jgi:hypothetical protein
LTVLTGGTVSVESDATLTVGGKNVKTAIDTLEARVSGTGNDNYLISPGTSGRVGLRASTGSTVLQYSETTGEVVENAPHQFRANVELANSSGSNVFVLGNASTASLNIQNGGSLVCQTGTSLTVASGATATFTGTLTSTGAATFSARLWDAFPSTIKRGSYSFDIEATDGTEQVTGTATFWRTSFTLSYGATFAFSPQVYVQSVNNVPQLKGVFVGSRGTSDFQLLVDTWERPVTGLSVYWMAIL